MNEYSVVTQILKVYSDLVHASRMRKAQHNTCVGLWVVAQLLEGGVAVLALGRHFTHSDLVTHHLDWLSAFYHLTTTQKQDDYSLNTNRIQNVLVFNNNAMFNAWNGTHICL